MTKPYYRQRHLDLNSEFNPYELIKSKMTRLSWSRLCPSEEFVAKVEIVNWFSDLRMLSEENAKNILIHGLLESEFHNITFIFKVSQHEDFKEMSSLGIYTLLYDFVQKTPNGIKNFIDESDYAMSRDVLALLAQKRSF